LTAKATRKARNSQVCAVMPIGIWCQSRIEKLPPDWMNRYSRAIRKSSEPNRVKRKNLNAA
jgi:hypothetical protein